MEDSNENQDLMATASSGRPGPVENVHFEFSEVTRNHNLVPDEAPNVDTMNETEHSFVVNVISPAVGGSQIDQPPVHTRHQPTTNEDLSSMQVQGEEKSQYYCGLCLENVQTNGSAAKEQPHTRTVCVHVGGAAPIVTAVEKNEHSPKKVEGYVSDFSDMSQAFYQALKRAQSEQNLTISAAFNPKQATIHEDLAPIVASGVSDKQKEENAVTETVLNNDPLTENKATEEDQEKQEDRELRQLWLTDLC